MDHDYSLDHTDYSKNNNFGIENPGIFNTDPRVKKWNCSLNNINQELESKKFSLQKIKDDPNVVRFYTGFENYDVLTAVCNCLKPKASRMHFWQCTDKCKDGTLKYQHDNINKPVRKSHCVNIDQIRCYFWSVFSCIWTDSVNLRIQCEYRKIPTRKNSVFGHFSCSEKALFIRGVFYCFS